MLLGADKRIGRFKEQTMKTDFNAVHLPFPREGLKDNKEAFATSQNA